jgi:hypothetical protein
LLSRDYRYAAEPAPDSRRSARTATGRDAPMADKRPRKALTGQKRPI